MFYNTHSEGDFLGVLPGFTYHADLLANSQDPVHTMPDQRDPSPRTGNHSQGTQLLHSMVSTHTAFLAAPMHYRHLERTKITALRHSHNYNTLVTTSDNMRQDLTWWLQELPRHNGRSMQIMEWDMVIESNASTLGWGASLNNTSMGGPWAPQERSHHINYLELLAAFCPSRPLPPTHTTRQFS